MSDGDAVIAGVGMMTAVGLSAPETTAAVRAKMMRFTESSILDGRFQALTLAEVPDQALPALAESLDRPGPTARERRLIRLASAPIRECLAGLPQKLRPVPLLLAVPESDTTRPLDGRRLAAALAIQLEGFVDGARAGAPFRGRAGGVIAIGRAADVVRAGQADFVVAGGVDTFRDLYVLATMDADGRLKTADRMDGFIPGEGAGFVLVARREAAAKAGMAPLATIASWGQAAEPGHLYSDEPYRGDGLAKAIALAVGAAREVLPIRQVFASMNGEVHWAREWGVGHTRSRAAFAPDAAMHHPADCYGETGAASGPLMVAAAAAGIRAGWGQASALVYGSSDRGDRGALVITA